MRKEMRIFFFLNNWFAKGKEIENYIYIYISIITCNSKVMKTKL